MGASASTSGPSDWFTTTHWSVVLAATGSNPAAAQAALERLCQTYWYPLYVFVRQKGFDREHAQDVTQGFFARLIEKQVLEQAAPARGRSAPAARRGAPGDWTRRRAARARAARGAKDRPASARRTGRARPSRLRVPPTPLVRRGTRCA